MKLNYFKMVEFDSPDVIGSSRFMNPQFLLRLDELRRRVGKPFVITSGYRTQAYNAKIGGVKYSGHTKGLAVDIRCADSALKWEILKNAFEMDFGQIGIYNNHLHIGDSSPLQRSAVWVGISK